MLNTVLNILLVILIIAAVILAILYFLGNKLQKRQLEQQQMLDAAAQTVSLLVIDKKKLKLTQAGLPKMVVDQLDQGSGCESKDRTKDRYTDR